MKNSGFNENLAKHALIDTLPVMAGYLVLGIGFGMMAQANGIGFFWVLGMSLFIYAGAMQYVTIGLLTGGSGLLTTALTTLMVNARHLFYGITMAERYKGTGKVKPYLIFGLTDETFSLVCNVPDSVPTEKRSKYFFLVSIFDQCYWVTGSVLGVLAGTLLPISTEGVDFSLTALFLVVVTDQWLTNKNHFPAIIGILATTVCLLIFGTDSFLIPAMAVIAAVLIGADKFRRKNSKGGEET